MGISIEEKISSLPFEKQKEYSERLEEVVYDRFWFIMHDMDYANYNLEKVKEIVFNEEYDPTPLFLKKFRQDLKNRSKSPSQ